MSVSPLAQLATTARRNVEIRRAQRDQRQIELTEAERYARDPFAWINDHVWITSYLPADGDYHRDSRVIRHTRMRLFEAQLTTIEAWIDLDHLRATGQVLFRNVVAEKSRQIGETVGLCAALTWLIHHHRVTGLCMHLDLSKIDDGGPGATWESMFGKIRHMNQRLDREQLPYLEPLVFKRAPSRIENPRLGSVIHGKGQGDDPGRGDSLDFAILDEAAIALHGEQVHQSLASACPVGKFYLSTPHGNDTMHARLATEKPKGWRYLRLHWSQHPVYSQGLHVAGQDDGCGACQATRDGVRYTSADPVSHRYPGRVTSPWYEAEVIGMTDQAVASELDIDRERSLAGRVYPEFDQGFHLVAEGIEYDRNVKAELAIDYGVHTTSVIVLQDTVEELRVIGLLEMGDDWGTTATPETVARELRLFLQELGVPAKETLPEFTRLWRGIGDPAGHAKSLATGRPFVQQYRRQGFNFGKPPSRLRRVDVGVSAVKALLQGWPKELRVCGVNAAAFADHMNGHVWPTDNVGRRRQTATAPEDNIHTHCCDAFRYFVVATYPPPGQDGATSTAPSDDPEPEEHPLTRRRRQARERQGLGDRDGAVDPGFGLEMTL